MKNAINSSLQFFNCSVIYDILLLFAIEAWDFLDLVKYYLSCGKLRKRNQML